MPIRKTGDGWFWGSQGPFATKVKALQVARAAHANGFEENEMTDPAAEFVQCLFHAVTNTHILHLQSKSYSQHVALGAYYESLIELADTYAEAYQGKYGIITGYTGDYKLPPGALEYLMEISDAIKIMRVRLPQDTELQNLIDEIASETDSTIYKLRFLA